MPDIEGIIKITNLLLQRIFGKNIPPWIAPLINWTLLAVLLLCGLWGLLVLLSKIKDVWVQSFLPLFYKPEQKRRQRRRQMFAKHVEYEISRLDLLEDWKDEHFAELEAEVEADGRRKRLALFPFNQSRNGLRREKSLSKALANSRERFILVEGEPGSGKSVALRHVALHMAMRAKKARSMKSIIPIYVNLKELERPDNGVVDRNLIEAFILKSLRRINDHPNPSTEHMIKVEQSLFPESLMKAYYKIQRYNAQGRGLMIHYGYKGNIELGNKIENKIVDRLLPQAKQDIEEGCVVQFGHFKISQHGISAGKRTLPWEQVGEFSVSNGEVTIKQRGESLRWVRRVISDIPNFAVFRKLVEAMQQRYKYPSSVKKKNRRRTRKSHGASDGRLTGID